jgi:hypothetical protein
MSASATDALHEGAELAFEAVEGGIEEFAAWNNDDIKTGSWFLVLEERPHPPFGAVSHDGAADFPRRRNPQPGHRLLSGPGEDRHEASVDASAGLISLFKVCAPADMLGRPEGHRSSDTVRRLRPLARRRFNTCCPSFVDIRTKKPCVFFRRRVLG